MQAVFSKPPGRAFKDLNLGRLILIRHCETESNAEGTVQGRQNTHLSPRGVLQAELVGDHLGSHFPSDRVVSSDRTRCLETISGIGVEPDTTPLLRELDFGKWEGRKWSDVASRYPKDIEKLLNSDPSFSPPGGDSLESLNERIQQAISEFDLLSSTKTTVVVSHDGTLRAMIAQLLGWNLQNMGNLSLFVGGISVISTQTETPKLELLNYYDHLSSSYAASSVI